MAEYTYHPVANAFPLIDGQDFTDLVEDIRKHGQRHPCVKTGTQIIDGRNRYRACVELDRECEFTEWHGEGSLAELSASLNLHRRHLEKSQRSAAAVAIADSFEDEAAERMRSGKGPTDPAAELQQGRSAKKAADLCKVSERSVYDARAVRKASPELFADVLNGRTKLAVATRAVHRDRKRAAAATLAATLPRPDPSACRLAHGDAVKFATGLASRSVRLFFLDPPYNCGIDYGKGSKADQLSRGGYLAWCYNWLSECARALTPDGSVFVMIDGRGLSDLMYVLEFCGLHRRNVIVWNEDFGNYTDANFSPYARFILYYTRDPDRFVFNSDVGRIPSHRQLVYGDKRADPSGKVPGNVWSVPRLADNHLEREPDFPTQVPRLILDRIVLAASEPGDVVCDLFSGSGTTAESAVLNGRKFLGCDNHKPNVAAGLARVARAIHAATEKGGQPA